MIGELVELSAHGRKLKCCRHLRERVGLVVAVDCTWEGKTIYWIDWIGMTAEEAYPRRVLTSSHARGIELALANGMWSRRDIRLVKKNK